MHKFFNEGTHSVYIGWITWRKSKLITLPNQSHTNDTHWEETGKDIFPYHFFLVLVLFPLKLNLAYLSHCKTRNPTGAKNSKQLCWHNAGVISQSRAQLLKKLKNDFEQSAKSSSQFYMNCTKRNGVGLSFMLKLFLISFFFFSQKLPSLLISCLDKWDLALGQLVKLHLLFHCLIPGFLFCFSLDIFCIAIKLQCLESKNSKETSASALFGIEKRNIFSSNSRLAIIYSY